MWSTISRLFVAKSSRSSTKTPEPGEEAAEENNHKHYQPACKNDDGVPTADLAVHVFESMDRNMGDDRRRGPGDQQHAGDSDRFSDTYETRQVC